MINENVVALPASNKFNAEQALKSVLEFTRTDNLQDVLIVGYDAAGDLLVRSSRLTRAEALFLLKKAEDWAMHGGLE